MHLVNTELHVEKDELIEEGGTGAGDTTPK
jgi:hypothetical protein